MRGARAAAARQLVRGPAGAVREALAVGPERRLGEEGDAAHPRCEELRLGAALADALEALFEGEGARVVAGLGEGEDDLGAEEAADGEEEAGEGVPAG